MSNIKQKKVWMLVPPPPLSRKCPNSSKKIAQKFGLGSSPSFPKIFSSMNKIGWLPLVKANSYGKVHFKKVKFSHISIYIFFYKVWFNKKIILKSSKLLSSFLYTSYDVFSFFMTVSFVINFEDRRHTFSNIGKIILIGIFNIFWRKNIN